MKRAGNRCVCGQWKELELWSAIKAVPVVGCGPHCGRVLGQRHAIPSTCLRVPVHRRSQVVSWRAPNLDRLDVRQGIAQAMHEEEDVRTAIAEDTSRLATWSSQFSSSFWLRRLKFEILRCDGCGRSSFRASPYPSVLVWCMLPLKRVYFSPSTMSTCSALVLRGLHHWKSLTTSVDQCA